MKVVLTGAAGFIGMHVAEHLLERGDEVYGIDSIGTYYEPALKLARLCQLRRYKNFGFSQTDIADRLGVEKIFQKFRPTHVINLAAQPGVRYSLTNPHAYVQSNLVGFLNILECCRHAGVKHLVYASSSSVYGANTKIPFSIADRVDHPVSFYAATKKANELMAYSYSHLYGLPTTGLRYFTVYGPWGRPDMAPWLFTSAIVEGREITVYNFGQMSRDFTFVGDIARGTLLALDKTPAVRATPNSEIQSSLGEAPASIYNLGNDSPETIESFIETIELHLGKKAVKKYAPLQPGDVISTYADMENTQNDLGFVPKTSLYDGIKKWVDWYRSYRNGDFEPPSKSKA